MGIQSYRSVGRREVEGGCEWEKTEHYDEEGDTEEDGVEDDNKGGDGDNGDGN